jgi:NADH-ubiquinone oxidoreductase chain 6
MNITNFFLEFLIVFSIFACLTVITSTNPIIAIIFLIGVFLSAAIYLIFIGLNFIGISYIIVYVGAITVLFLFVIMLLNIDLLYILEIGSQYSKNLPLVLTISGLFSYLLFIVILPLDDLSIFSTLLYTLTNLNGLFGNSNKFEINTVSSFVEETNNLITVEPNLISFSQIESLGLNLYTNFSLILIIASIILLLAMVAPILLVGKNNNKNTSIENLL